MPTLSRRAALGALGALGASAVFVAARTIVVPGRSGTHSARFLLPEDYAFLNTGALGASPENVLLAADAAWRRLELAPVYEGYGPLAEDADAVRVRAAKFLGADPAEVCITQSTTDGMNLIAEGITLQPGDRVLLTDHEHHGGTRCWEHAARHRGVQLDYVRLPVTADDPDAITALVREAMMPNTRVVSVSHVTYTTGTRLPIRATAEVVRGHGALFVVDGAQAAGAMKVDVKALGCDAYAASGHKWMMGAKGTGLLYIAANARDRIHPTRLSDGPAVYTSSTGVVDLPGMMGLGAALAVFAELGIDTIATRNLALRDRLYEALSARRHLRVVSPAPGELAAPMVTITIREDLDLAALHQTLREKHRVSVKRLPDPPVVGLRFATHVYNDEEDVERLLRALDAELRA